LQTLHTEVTTEAIEPCHVKIVRKQEFIDFLGKHGIPSMRAAQSLSSEYMTVFHGAKRLALSGSAGGRLARLLLGWARSAANGKPELRFTMALTHEKGANMADTWRETVTRLLNQFRRDKWIAIKAASMTILTPDQLERLTAYSLLPRHKTCVWTRSGTRTLGFLPVSRIEGFLAVFQLPQLRQNGLLAHPSGQLIELLSRS
jgi:Crp-like helix-turn-helix domain